jgi:hypothetical protein
MHLFANIQYEAESYRRLVGYALSFAGGLIDKIKIGLPNYNTAQHKNEVVEIRLGFGHRSEVIEPFSYNSTLVTLLEDN